MCRSRCCCVVPTPSDMPTTLIMWCSSEFCYCLRFPTHSCHARVTTNAWGILTASLLNVWRRPPGRPLISSRLYAKPEMKNLSLNKTIDMAQNQPLCRDCRLCLACHTFSDACRYKIEELRDSCQLCLSCNCPVFFAEDIFCSFIFHHY